MYADSKQLSDLRAGLRLVLESFAPVVWREERAKFRHVTFQLDRLRAERIVSVFPELFGLLYDGSAERAGSEGCDKSSTAG